MDNPVYALLWASLLLSWSQCLHCNGVQAVLSFLLVLTFRSSIHGWGTERRWRGKRLLLREALANTQLLAVV